MTEWLTDGSDIAFVFFSRRFWPINPILDSNASWPDRVEFDSISVGEIDPDFGRDRAFDFRRENKDISDFDSLALNVCFKLI